MKEKEKNVNRYSKILKITYNELEIAEDRIAQTVDCIAEKGGKVISIPSPTVFGYKPTLLIFCIVYEAEKQIITDFPAFSETGKQKGAV